MSTAFICGSISELNPLRDESTFENAVKTVIEKYCIDKLYLCKRNKFDYYFLAALLANSIHIEVIELADENKNDVDYLYSLNKSLCFKRLNPFEGEIENSVLYRSLYDYAIENSDYMITNYKFDDDIAAVIAQTAEKKGIKVINIRGYFNVI